MSFGAGWVALSHIVSISPINVLTLTGLILLCVGMGITIKTLSTIKKIDLVIEELPNE